MGSSTAGQAGGKVPLLRPRHDSRRAVSEQPRGNQDVRGHRHFRHIGRRARRHGLHRGQGGVRQFRRLQKAPPCVCEPEAGGHGEERLVGAAASGRRKVLQGKGPALRPGQRALAARQHSTRAAWPARAMTRRGIS
ncbi:hypothetical protein G6F64_014413 [Rhizopus arrhizus]|uniref:Uncharacterized protein n=1 Tax=Rhizopus oryzae TaxID=64495 RepID=A0A9P6WU59_RHIOR|nr:hypothetical protein G6F64_014413 [Rhizopus arrhizus]